MATVTISADDLKFVYSQLNFLRNYVGVWSLDWQEHVVKAAPAPAPVAAPVAAVTAAAVPAAAATTGTAATAKPAVVVPAPITAASIGSPIAKAF